MGLDGAVRRVGGVGFQGFGLQDFDALGQQRRQDVAQLLQLFRFLALGVAVRPFHQLQRKGAMHAVAQALLQHGPGLGAMFLELAFDPGEQRAVRRRLVGQGVQVVVVQLFEEFHLRQQQAHRLVGGGGRGHARPQGGRGPAVLWAAELAATLPFAAGGAVAVAVARVAPACRRKPG